MSKVHEQVIQLYPQSGDSVALRGLYLRRPRLGQTSQSMPCVYAIFLTSLDGRIALKKPNRDDYELPAQLKSEEDYMLLLELYAHADCIITHGGYMRALSEGRLGNVLQLPRSAETQYIHAWREQQGLKPDPDVAIVSGSLNFPWHDSLDQFGQRVHIASGRQASFHHRQQWVDRGHNVYQFGDANFVDVNKLMAYLQSQGYRSICLMAGPDLLQDMLRYQYVQHFFITMPHQFLSGKTFKTLLNGDVFDDIGQMTLKSLYMQERNSNGVGQWFMEFLPNKDQQ